MTYGYVWMWKLDCEESWALKNWCFWTVVLEKTLESPLDCKEIQPVHSEGDQPWVFFGRNNAKAEIPVLWPPHAKSWLFGKDCDAGRVWGQEEKGTTEDEMAGWHHWLDGHEFGWTPGVGDGQGGLACYNSWGHKESDTTEQLNWTELNHYIYYCGQDSLRRNRVIIIVNKRVQNAVLGCTLKNDRMISVCCQDKPLNITVIQVYALTSSAEETEVEWFYEDLQDLLELTPPKDVLFIIGDWNTKEQILIAAIFISPC